MSFKDVLNQNRWLTSADALGEALYQIAYEFERQQDRIRALECRIDSLQGKLLGYEKGFKVRFQNNERRIDELTSWANELESYSALHYKRIEKLERKLNQKGGEE